MEAEFTYEQREEFGLEFDHGTKKKIMGENAAELYDIDIEEQKEKLAEDAISAEFDLGDQYGSATAD